MLLTPCFLSLRSLLLLTETDLQHILTMVLLYKTAYDIIFSHRFFFFTETILGNVNTIYIYIYEMIMAE